MIKQHRSLLLYGSIILAAFLLFACRFSVPSIGNKPATVPLKSGPGLLPDPTAGLAGLQSYQVAFQQDVTGSLDGSPFERHTSIELTRLPSGQVDFTREIQGSQEIPSYFHAIQTDQAAYRWNRVDENCQGEAGTLQPGEILEPASLLLPLTQTTKVGNETVNGIASVHYSFNESALALAEPKPSIRGDLWLADPGGYVVKYSLNAAGPSKTTGKGMEVGQVLSYELTRADSVEALSLPSGCLPVPVELPVMADATDVVRASGMVEYLTASTASDVVGFYNQKLGPLGWTPAQTETVAETKLPAGLLFSKGDLNLSVNIDSAEAGGLDVTLVVQNPAQQAAAVPPTPVPTPAGPQPTIDPTQAGLPDDVPLYPGSTTLQSLGGMGIGFIAPDAPEVVAAFYKDKLVAEGWKLVTENSTAEQITLLWQKDNRMVSLVISPAGGKSDVILMVTTQ